MEFKIRQIIDSDDPVLETVCKWIFQWWEENDAVEQEKIRATYKRSVFEDRIPQTYVAYYDGVPVGTFQLAMADNNASVRPDVYPWLKNVYVIPEFRSRGCAGKMMEYAVEKINKLGQKKFFLFTHLVGFYEQFGWEFVEVFDTCDPWLKQQRLYKLQCK